MSDYGKKLTAVFTAALLLTGTAPNLPGSVKLLRTNLTASAEDAPTSGTCGKNLTWSFDWKTGVLKIEGTGNMDEYGLGETSPWIKFSSEVKKLELPEGLTSIGTGAFAGCRLLDEITVPESVTFIGEFATSNLKRLTILGDTTRFDYMSICFCDGHNWEIRNYPIIRANSGSWAAQWALEREDDYVDLEYLDAQTDPDTGLEIIQNKVCSGKNCTGDIVIPEGITAVMEKAFANNDKLTSVTLPSTCTELGALALYHCPNLKKVTFLNPDTVVLPKNKLYCNEFGLFGLEETSKNEATDKWIELPGWYDPYHWAISNNSFEFTPNYKRYDTMEGGWHNCYGMTEMAVFNGTICGEIGSAAEKFAYPYCDFKSLDGLTEIPGPNAPEFSGTCGKNLTWSLDTVNEVLTIEGMGPMYEYTVSEYELNTHVYDAPWYGLKYKTVIIPDTVSFMGDITFRDCTEDLVIKGYTGSYAEEYANKNKITFESLGEATTFSGTCGDALFWLFDRSSGTLTISGQGSMYNGKQWDFIRKELKHVVITNGVTNIGEEAFRLCSALTSITIADSVKSIGKYAFAGCSSLTEINIPDSVTRIDERAFYSCSKLRSIDMSDNVTYVGYLPFEGTPWWNTQIAGDSPVIVGKVVYYGQNCKGEVVLPDGVKSIASTAFRNCTALTSVTIPESMTSIGDYAFQGCTGLTSITIPDSVTSISKNAFSGCKELTIKGYTGSYAEEYAKENDFKFIALDDETCWGDVNCDSSVDIADAVLICRFAVADAEAEITDQGRKQADVTHDGTVDAKDSEKLVQYIAKKLTADDLTHA